MVRQTPGYSCFFDLATEQQRRSRRRTVSEVGQQPPAYDRRPLKQLAPSLTLQRLPGIAFLSGVDSVQFPKLHCHYTS